MNNLIWQYQIYQWTVLKIITFSSIKSLLCECSMDVNDYLWNHRYQYIYISYYHYHANFIKILYLCLHVFVFFKTIDHVTGLHPSLIKWYNHIQIQTWLTLQVKQLKKYSNYFRQAAHGVIAPGYRYDCYYTKLASSFIEINDMEKILVLTRLLPCPIWCSLSDTDTLISIRCAELDLSESLQVNITCTQKAEVRTTVTVNHRLYWTQLNYLMPWHGMWTQFIPQTWKRKAETAL